MKNCFKKIALLSMVCGVFAGANEIPNNIKRVIKSINSAEVYYDTVSTIGDNHFFTPMFNVGIDNKKQASEAIKNNIDNNKTYQTKISELKAKNEDFCGNFYEDLKEFKNMEIKKPLFKEVTYDNHDFRKVMGQCYYMGMDWVLLSYNAYGVKSNGHLGASGMDKPHSYTIYSTNFLGENNLFLIQNYTDTISIDHGLTTPNKAPIKKTFTVLNINLCESVFKSLGNSNNFNIFKDRKVIDEIIPTIHQDPTIITYKGQDYIFGYFDDKEHTIVTLESGFPESPYSGYDLEDLKCNRTYWK